jgi:hypothetical protein
LYLDAGNVKSYPGSGVTWTDLSGYGNVGTLTNGPIYNSANGGSIVFDGVNDYVTGMNDVSISTSQPFTLEFWCNVTAYSDYYPTLIQIKTNTTYACNLSLCYSQAGYRGIIFGSNTSWANMKTDVAPSAGVWHQVVLTYNGAGATTAANFTFYLDTVVQPTTATGNFNALSQVNYIGTTAAASRGIDDFVGSIAVAKVYNRALSSAEIVQNYFALSGRYDIWQNAPALWLDASDASTLFQSNGGAAASADNDPVGYWKDKSGNGKHLSQSDPTMKPLLKTSVQNSRNVVRFDGSNDYIGILSATGLYVDDISSMAAFVVARSSVYEQSYKKFFSYGANNNYSLGTYTTTKRMYSDPGVVASSTALTNGVAVQATLAFAASSVTIYKDGVSDGTGTRAANTNYTGDFYLGATTNAPIRDFLTGDICEFILFIGAISTAQRQAVESYLKLKWGTP